LKIYSIKQEAVIHRLALTFRTENLRSGIIPASAPRPAPLAGRARRIRSRGSIIGFERISRCGKPGWLVSVVSR